MLKSRIGMTGAALCGLLLCMPAFAQTQAGSVLFAAGDVRIVDTAGRERRALKGDGVNEGETLVSGAGASAQLRMKDGGFIALRPQSRLRIDTYTYSGREDGTERSLLSLLKGGFRTITGFIGRTQKDRYVVRTPTATIGIRGTDHEPLYIAPPVAGETPMGPPGTYDKVNVGIAYIETPTGSVDILPNQVGFAAPGAVPQVLPRIPEFFRATGEPSADRQRAPAGTEADQAAAQREQVASDAPARPPREEAAPPAPPPAAKVPEPAVAVTGTGDTGTVDLTAQTITDPAGSTAPIQTVITAVRVPDTLAVATSYGSAGGFAFADDFTPRTSEAIRDSATNALIGVGEQFGGFKWGLRLVAPAPVTPAVSTTAAGIEYGRWSGGTLEQSWTAPIGNALTQGEGFVNAPRWGYAPEGVLDSANQTLTGNFTYAFDSATAPIDRASGQTATLNNAKTTFTADFTNSLWSANVELTLGADTWTANAASVAFSGNSGSAFATPGGTSNNLTVTKGICSTCLVGGSIDWGFTGQNYRGVLLAYNVYEQSATGGKDLADIGGTVAFTNNGATTINTGGTVTPTGNSWVADTNGGLMLVPTAQVVTSGGVLTGYSADSGTPGGPYFNVSTSAGTTGTVINATDTATGIVLGTWDSGSTTYVYGQPLGTGQFHWALGPEVSPLYLPQALTGTLAYTLDAWTAPTNQAGSAGSVSAATTLTVDFTRQIVGLDLSLTGVGGHDWSASAPDMRLDGRRFDSFNAVTPMTVTMDPLTTPVTGSGEIAGSLTGAGVNGAAVSYALSAQPAGKVPMEAVNGVLAFSATAQDTAAPYRIVGATGSNLGGGTEPWNFVNGEYNAASRVAFDTAAPPNLTTFDSTTSATGGSMAVTVTPGSLAISTDAGTDSTTGISWGRWAGDVVVVTDRATGTIARVPNPGSLHWIAGPEMIGPVALPTSGTFAYTLAGSTTPTDQAGIAGTLNSATLSANFTAMTVDAQVNATVDTTTLNGLAQGMAIMPRGHFGTETGTMSVTCTGTCGTAAAGAMGGAFTGATGNGAALLYHMTTTGGALAAPIAISGAAAFKR